MYSPPSSKIDFDLFPLKRDERFIFAGDFNAHHKLWSKKTDTKGCQLLEWCRSNNLLIANDPGFVTLPRHGTSPDAILHHEELQLLHFGLIGDGSEHGSDHLPLAAVFDTFSPLETVNNQASKKSVWDFNTADWYSFRLDLDYRLSKVNSPPKVGIRAATFNRILLHVAKKNIRRRLRIQGKRRRLWNSSTPETKQAKGKFVAEKLAQGEGFAFAFKKIKDLDADGGQDIQIPEFSEDQLPSKFLDQFVKTSVRKRLNLRS